MGTVGAAPDRWRIKRLKSGRWGVFPPLYLRAIYHSDTFGQAIRALPDVQRNWGRRA